MGTPSDDERLGRRGKDCGGCGGPLRDDQRYCLRCGERRGPLPVPVAERLAAVLGAGDRKAAAAEKPEPSAERTAVSGFMPTPRAAAAAVMAMLAFGVVLGSGTSQLAQSAGLNAIVLEVASTPPLEEELAEAPAATPSAAEESLPLLPEAATSSLEAPLPPQAPAIPEAPAEPKPPLELPEEETLPPVKHVFLIVLGENGYEETFGAGSTAPYLAKKLPEKGELISNYYAVAKGDLANQIALLSGQGPTPETAAGCPTYADLLPGTLSLAGQVEGSGCVYPAATPTLPGQLAEKELSWRAYVEDIGNGAAAGQPTSCRHPALGAADPSPAPIPGDAYVTWRNPFVYFHSLTDGEECAENDVGLDRLAADLKSAKKTPTLSYVVPNACHDGGETPCEEGQPSGPAEAEAFLKQVVPEIEASPAYKEGGLIAIVSAQARQTGPTPDASSCCIAPEYPNLPPEEAAAEAPPGPVKPSGGGGQVGLLLISPFVTPGSSNKSGYYNHYSLLLSIEELFELERIGYASEIALVPFDGSVYDYEASSSSASCRDCASKVPSADQSSPSSSKNPWRASLDLNTTR